MSPRWGDAATGGGTLWQEQVYRHYVPEAMGDAWALDARGERGLLAIEMDDDGGLEPTSAVSVVGIPVAGSGGSLGARPRDVWQWQPVGGSAATQVAGVGNDSGRGGSGTPADDGTLHAPTGLMPEQ